MIPNKSSFRFEELTPITGVKPYVIRYWETEFPEIAPVLTESGHKMYSRRDIEIIFKIKKLLFEERMAIPAAKAIITNGILSNQTDPEVRLADKEEVQMPAAEAQRGEHMVDVRPFLLSALDSIKEIKMKRNW